MQDSTTRLWDVRHTARSLALLRSHMGAVRSLRFSPDGSVLAVADAFRGMSRVARSRAVHEALAAEFAGGMHALALRLRTPEEDARAGD